MLRIKRKLKPNLNPSLPIIAGVLLPFFVFSTLVIADARPQNKKIEYEKLSIRTAEDIIEQVDPITKEITTHTVKHEYVSNQVLVKFKEEYLDIKQPIGQLKKAIFEATENVDVQKEYNKNNLVLVKTSGNESIFEKIEEIEKNPNVEFAEPNYVYKIAAGPVSSDTLINSQYAINNTGQTIEGQAGIADADMDIMEMWEIESATGSEVSIGIIDTGINEHHTDIDGNIVTGYDFTHDDTNPEDIQGHGSHLAGIIAAESDNSSGISGVSKYNNLKVVPLKVSIELPYYEGIGQMYSNLIVEAIEYAEANDIKIINMSLGSSSYSAAMYTALSNYSGLAVVAAGNESCNVDADCNVYPAEFNLANIITISSTDNTDAMSSFSNYGTTSIDIAAPGSDILSLDTGAKIYEENFDDLSSTFTASPAGTWTYATADGSDYVSIVDPFDEYDTSVNSTFTSADVVTSGSLSEYIARSTIFCEMDLSSDSDGINGDIDAGDTDYLELEVYDGSTWEDAVRFKSITSTTEINHSGFVYGGTISPATSDFRIRYRFVSDATPSGSNLGCHIDDIAILDRTQTDADSYIYKSGTSMATPYAAGVAGMLWSYNPSLSVAQVKSILMSTGDSIASQSGKTLSGKRINAYSAYNEILAPVIAEVTPVSTPTQDTTPNYTFSSSKAGTISYGGSCSSATTAATAGSNTITFSTLATGTYDDCTITVTGSYSNASNVLTVTEFMVTDDVTAPTLSEVTEIGSTNDKTPDYTFNSSEEGTISYDGSCDSTDTEAVSGNNTITFSRLDPGTYSGCGIIVTDAANNTSDTLAVTEFTIVFDGTAPVLAEETPVSTPTEDTTPDYTFSSTEAGDITYGGDCSSATSRATAGSNTITFDALAAGEYSNCTITVTDDAENESSALSVSSFTIIDNTPPTLTEVTPVTSPTTDTTPNYSFSSTESGTITYSGSCDSDNTSATAGTNTITFNELALGTYDNCSLTVTDASDNESDALSISPFTVEEETSPEDGDLANARVSGSKNHEGKYRYGTRVTLSAGDGVAKIKYHFDDDEYKTYEKRKGLLLPEGESKLYWKALDSDGNILERHSKTFNTMKKDPIKDLRGELNEAGDEIKLTWNLGYNKVGEVKIYRGDNPDFEMTPETLIGHNDKDDDDYTDRNLPGPGFYYYKVAAYGYVADLLDEDSLGSWMNSQNRPVTLAYTPPAQPATPPTTSTINPSTVVLGASDYIEDDYTTRRYVYDKTTASLTYSNNESAGVFSKNYKQIVLTASLVNALVVSIFLHRKAKVEAY